jgi:hypothetical protein
MEDNTAKFSIGDVLGELGVSIPTTEEQTPDTTEATENTAAENVEETVAEAEVENTETHETDEPQTDEESEPADEDEEIEDEEHAEEDRTVKKLNRRVDKLTARAKTAEERAASLEQELAQARDAVTKAQPIVLPQSSSDPLGDVNNIEDLDSRLSSAHIVLDEVPDLIAKADFEGGEVEVPMGNGSTRKFTKTELQDRLRMAKGIIKSEPARRRYIAEREMFVEEAKSIYPEFFKETPARKMMVDTLRQHPELSRLPNIELIIGDAMRGQQLRFQEIEANKKAATAKVRPAAAPAKPAIAPKVVSPNSAPKTKVKPDPLDALKKAGNRDAAEKFMESIFN